MLRSQSPLHNHLFCVLPHGFLSKNCPVRSLTSDPLISIANRLYDWSIMTIRVRETFQHCQASLNKYYKYYSCPRYKSSDVAKQQEEIRSLKVNSY